MDLEHEPILYRLNKTLHVSFFVQRTTSRDRFRICVSRYYRREQLNLKMKL